MLSRLLVALVVCCSLFAISSAQGGQDWPNLVDAPTEAVEFKPAEDWSLPIPKKSGGTAKGILRPATPSRFAMLGYGTGPRPCAVWDLIDRQLVGELTIDFGYGQKTTALSPDGRHVVVLQAPRLEVWNVETGKKVRTFGLAVYTLDYVAFRNNEEFIVRWDSARRGRVTVLSLKANENAETNIDLPEGIDDNSLAISPGGKYLSALAANANTLRFIDLEQRKAVASIDLGRPEGSFWHTPKAAAFSPDGSELAMVLETGSTELAVFDLSNGKRLPGIPVERSEFGIFSSARHDLLQWVPDGSGWLLDGRRLIDRNSTRLVWRFNGYGGAYAQLVGLDHLLIAAGKGEAAAAQAVRIPWKEAERRLELVKSGAEALIGQGAAVSIEVTVSDVRLAEKEAVTAIVRKTLESRFEALGITVKEDAPCICRVAYSESAGPELTIEKRSLLDPIPPFAPPPLPPPLPPLFGSRFGGNREDGPSYGSGVVITPDGHVLSCEHVVGKAKKVRVVAGGTKYEADVVAVDAKRDLALLKIIAAGKEPVRLRPLILAGGEKAEVGAEVRAFGFPLSSDKSATLSVNKGTVSGWAKRGGTEQLQVDAAVNPGNSGGPLLDDFGEVVGINVAKVVGEAVDNVGFAIPAGQIREFLAPHKLTLSASESREKREGVEIVKQSSDAICLVVAASKGVPDAPDTKSTPGDDPSAAKPDGPVKVISTAYKGSIQMVNRATDKGVWFWNYGNDGRTMFLIGRPATEQGLRDFAFDGFLANIRTMTMPEYLSKDDPPIVFPGETDLGKVPVAKQTVERPSIPKKATKRGQE